MLRAVQRIDAKQIALAFADSTFFFEYQPIVELVSTKVPYVEALVRWDHPTLGVLSPGSFLSLIHGAGLSNSLTDWSLRQVLADLPELRELYGVDVAASINLSQRQLIDPEATACLIASTIEEFDEDPRSICIEVVEDLTGPDIRRSASAIADLRSIGVRFFLDDFGTGASSLSALTEIDCDGLKIDRSFVQSMVSGSVARSIVESILAVGSNTGLSVVAEGVESSLELHALNEIDCVLGQGFFLGRPKPIAEGAQHVGYTPVVRAPTKPIADVAGVDALVHQVDQVNPRSTLESFEQLRDKLVELDAWAEALGAEGEVVRCEIGRRLTMAAVYAGEHATSVRWAMRTSRLAERIGQWGYSAVVLTMLAAGPNAPGENPGLRIEAMTRALEIRMIKSIDTDRGSAIDNGIGAVFANLGLWDHALSWWKDCLDRNSGLANAGIAMCSINFVELELDRFEGFVTLSDDTPRELRIALIEQVLDRLETNPFTPGGAIAALRCRLEVAQGNLDAAAELLANSERSVSDIVPLYLTLRAQAILAQASENCDGFLESTTDLVAVLDGNRLMTHHDQRAQQMHVKALSAVGRNAEAVALLEELLLRQRLEDGEKLQTMFEWIRLNVDLNLRFAELERLQLNAPS